MDSCWHCSGLGQCSCITCGQDGIGNVWVLGPCLACKGRDKWNRFRPHLERAEINVGDPKNWELRGNRRDQAGPKLVFLPEEQFDEWEKRKASGG